MLQTSLYWKPLRTYPGRNFPLNTSIMQHSDILYMGGVGW